MKQGASRILQTMCHYRRTSCHKLVAQAQHGDEEGRPSRIVLEFLSQARDMNIDSAGICARTISPDILE